MVESEIASSNAGLFASWAKIYDEQPNPLLILEERYLTRLLPCIQDKDVLDAGCGTGRWLERLAAGKPSSLHGADGSSEMLHIAAGKQLPGTKLTQATLSALPVATSSIDLTLASFVLSYVEDLARCAAELARVARHGCDLMVSDMHPDTASTLGWKRSFGSAGSTHTLQAQQWSIEEVKNTFAANGFELVACVEPSFGEVEHELFRMRSKHADWERSAEMPAIYLLQLRRLRNRPTHTTSKAAHTQLRMHGAHCALGPNELTAASVSIEEGVISSLVSTDKLSRQYRVSNKKSIDLNGYLLFPGLINAHDHLEFSLFPRLGYPPYRNATHWATDIHETQAATIALYKQVPKDVRLWWGGIRNLLCGATTVCHHNPLDPLLQAEDFPIRVVTRYSWEHSLDFARDIAGTLEAAGTDEPFLIHACEGIDHEASEEFHELYALHAIEPRTILVHGLALDEASITLLNQRGSSLIICPSSNSFLFEATHTHENLLSIERLALGSDSPLTAAGDLLDELRFAKSACSLHAEELYPMVTDKAANILRLQQGEGSSRPGSVADLVAVRHRAGTPAGILAELSWRDVELVIVGGRVHLASTSMLGRLPEDVVHDLTPLMMEGELRWFRGPVSTMLQAAEYVLGKGNVHLGQLRISAVEV